MSRLRTTRTYAILEVSTPAYEEIRKKLTDAGYAHAFHGDVIDCDGIAIGPEEATEDKAPVAEEENTLP